MNYKGSGTNNGSNSDSRQKEFKCPCEPCTDSYCFERSLRYHIRRRHNSYFLENFSAEEQSEMNKDKTFYVMEFTLLASGNELEDTAEEE